MAVSELRERDVAEDITGLLADYLDPSYFGKDESLEYDAKVDESGRRVLVTATDHEGNERHFEIDVREVVSVPEVTWDAMLGDIPE